MELAREHGLSFSFRKAAARYYATSSDGLPYSKNASLEIDSTRAAQVFLRPASATASSAFRRCHRDSIKLEMISATKLHGCRGRAPTYPRCDRPHSSPAPSLLCESGVSGCRLSFHFFWTRFRRSSRALSLRRPSPEDAAPDFLLRSRASRRSRVSTGQHLSTSHLPGVERVPADADFPRRPRPRCRSRPALAPR
jgi:hypothetical protein